MSYILNERIPIEKAIFIHEMSYKDFKVYTSSCKNDEERKKLFNIVKCVVNNAINNNGSVSRTYKYSDSMETLGRLCSNGMQGVKKIFRGFLMSDTTDIDMDNAHPVILSYICKKHDIPCENLDYYNANRDDVLSSYPDKTRAEAKTHFLKCINNDKHNKNDKHVFYRKWDNEIKRIQFALSNLSEYNKICETVPDSRDYNVKGSQISRILGTYEDKILHVVLDTMKKKEIEVAVLMYDGCMVYGDWYKNTELLSQITEDVESEFNGLNMKWSYKPHNTDIVIPEGWKSKKMAKLLKENVEKVETVEDVKITGIYEGDDSGASKMILEKYPHWKCCNDVLYVFDDMTGMWSDKIDIQNNIISRYAEFLDIIKTGVDGTVQKTGHNYAKNNQKRKDIYPFIRENCVDNDWIVRTETSSLGKILFLNGHYDFKRSKFMTGKKISATDDEKKNTDEENGFNPEIVFFYRVDHELTEFNEDELAYMDSIQERLFTLPLGKDVGDYLTLNLARAFSGDITIKRILFGLGMSNSGKGILTKACQLSMGQYCGVFTGENLAFNNVNNDEAQKMRWAMLLRNKRLIISHELSTKKMLDGNLIKKLASGGDTIQGRLHGQHETDFNPQYLAILLANDMPDIKPFDTAIQNRVRVHKSFCR